MRNIANFLALVLALCALPLITLWLVSKIDYFIGRSTLRITWFGLTVKRIPFANIKRVSKRSPSKSASYWVNVSKLSHRMVTVHLREGRPVVVSPANRYIFIADLKRAVQAALPKEHPEDMPEFDETDTSQLRAEN